ncbi:MAG: GDSL-type esterase/lipase family protein, partial [Oleibacter sp.]|nr:GDSL-type esterase/lipase family protein [Thalassolituus sp.]
MTKKRFFYLIVALGLAASVMLNFILYRYVNQYYFELNRVRLDPLGVVFYKSSDKPLNEVDQKKSKVVFYGDSRANQWTNPKDLNQFVFLNRGIGTQTSTQVVGRFDQHIAPINADILVVQVCINDLKAIPLYSNLQQEIIDNCKSNIKKIVDKASTQGTSVILTTIFPLGELPIERRIVWSDEIAKAMLEVNEYIYTLQDESVVIYDTKAVLADENGQVRKEYELDYLHLNKKGY